MSLTASRTITFQPDDDVRKALAYQMRAIKPDKRRGLRTRIINEAIRRFAKSKIAKEAAK